MASDFKNFIIVQVLKIIIIYCIFLVFQLNMHFMKKIPPGSEAANVLVGEVDFLNHMIVAFIRLKTSSVMGDLTEVGAASDG